MPEHRGPNSDKTVETVVRHPRQALDFAERLESPARRARGNLATSKLVTNFFLILLVVGMTLAGIKLFKLKYGDETSFMLEDAIGSIRGWFTR